MKGFKGKEMTKMLICRKKAIALGALVVLVGVAGYLNFVYDKSGNGAQSTLTEYVETVKDIENEQENAGEAQPVSGEVKNADYFVSARLNRETARSEGIELLKSTIDNANVSAEAKTEAENKIFEISDNIETEVNIENVLKSKGFSDVLVSVSDSQVSVAVRSDGLTAPQTAQINDAVEQFVSTNNVKIVEVP